MSNVNSGTTSTNVTVNNGDVLNVLSGGTAIGTTIDGGGLEYVFDGGTASGTVISSGGKEVVYSGGRTYSSVVSAGGREQVLNGTATDITLSGGNADVYTGGVARGTVVGNGSVQTLFGGLANVTVVSAGGAELVDSGGVSVRATILAGGAENVASGGVAFATFLSNGSENIFDGGMAISTTVASGGSEVVFNGGVATNTVLLAGGTIDLTNVAYSASGTVSFNAQNDMLTVTEGATTYTQQLSGDYTGETFSVSEDCSGDTLISVACFAAGTHILTDRGEVTVEALAAGDLVRTAAGGQAPIVWMGRRHMDLASHPDRELAQPVRIQPGAFGPGRPHTPLLLSPEHAVFVSGTLVPVRHLVGCPGIDVDTTLDSVTYYHVELPRHDVILAEGLPCESWLDTGNRPMFENAAIAALTFDERPVCAVIAADVWAKRGCAPLVTAGPVLAHIRALLESQRVDVMLLDRPGRHRLTLAPGGGQVRLLSATGRAPGDRRVLGAAIGAVWLDGHAVGLSDACLSAGFHPAEAGWRWTDGAATLDFGASEEARTVQIEVHDILTARAA